MKYVSLLMSYIEQEYDNVPADFTPEIDEYFRQCYLGGESIPNAAGMFAETFLRANT